MVAMFVLSVTLRPALHVLCSAAYNGRLIQNTSILANIIWIDWFVSKQRFNKVRG
jgi:hypothetical protein